MLGSFGGNISNTVAPIVNQTVANQPGNGDKATQQIPSPSKSEASAAPRTDSLPDIQNSVTGDIKTVTNPPVNAQVSNAPKPTTPPPLPGVTPPVPENEENAEIVGDSGTAQSLAQPNGIDQEEAELSAEEQQVVREMQQRDAEVKAHEAAHKAAGGGLTGGASYSYETGPDGQRYAVSGEVGIDVGRESDPEATIDKMQTVKAAAMAPADPSSTDRAVAAAASRVEAQAKSELAAEKLAEAKEANAVEAPEELTTPPAATKDTQPAKESEKGAQAVGTIEANQTNDVTPPKPSGVEATANVARSNTITDAYQPIKPPDANSVINELV